ncbi:MAG: Asp-tRNA(Asn)/Glu-tRNA(Gln) amidotransferase subunit GatB [Nanoarchaeota archaeon]
MNDIIIGLECHVSLNTKTKLFCSCALTGSEEPNSRTCEVCVGLPGSKPVLNKKALDYALKLCLALKCDISPELIFSRKVYFYDDLPKNYQITQYEVPLGVGGNIKLTSGKIINLTRVHIEEDPGALIHQGNTVLVDYNRSGTPLCEIVTEPEMSSPEEARDFLKRLLSILQYLQIFDIDSCIIKADANISIKGFERVEIKNINGFKDIQKALEYEISRQRILVSEGKGIKHRETRGWDSDKGITVFQRSKELEADYGYIIDTDLVITDITNVIVEETKKHLPELPDDKIIRFVKDFKLKKDDAEVIANYFDLAHLFEKAVDDSVNPLFASEWIRREVSRVLNYAKKDIDESFIKNHLLEVLELINKNTITRQTGQRIMEILVNEDLDVNKYVKDNNLESVSNTSELEKICLEAIKNNKQAVDEYKAGNEKSFNFIIGQVMKLSKGKASPSVVNDLLKKLIK